MFKNGSGEILPCVRSAAGLKDNSKWSLTWSDEFQGPAGSGIDKTKWSYRIGGGGWGNKEFQYYTDSTKNSFHDGHGNLVIKAIEEGSPAGTKCWYGKCRYTSARLVTEGKFAQKYGKIEARIKVPYGQGIWPAFWMLGDDFKTEGWPDSGEIDILENIGREPGKVYGTIHGPGYAGAKGIGKSFKLESGKKFTDNFHVFAIEWEPNEIRWYVDGKHFHTVRPKDLPKGAKWVYDHPHFMLLNLAVGGNWPGSPDNTTVFPQQMKIDYVRVYEKS
ncbi:MAG: glycoside hydrolase family 16 protein [Pyrinomonadaceae bacterium]|nr:glycoside hydrolase family 16 protein [Pyrinomonadaceae bacterium]